MKSYVLVNPYIEGSFETEYKASSADEAANMAYENLSKFFSNNIPKFAFTIQKGGSDKFYHYNVNEKINGDDKIKFELQRNTSITNIDGLLKFIEKNDEEHAGGGKYSKHYYKYKDDSSDSSDSSSSESEDYYYYYKPVNRPMPITYWSYYPYVYNIRKLYVPTFIPSILPYVYITIETKEEESP